MRINRIALALGYSLSLLFASPAMAYAKPGEESHFKQRGGPVLSAPEERLTHSSHIPPVLHEETTSPLS